MRHKHTVTLADLSTPLIYLGVLSMHVFVLFFLTTTKGKLSATPETPSLHIRFISSPTQNVHTTESLKKTTKQPVVPEKVTTPTKPTPQPKQDEPLKTQPANLKKTTKSTSEPATVNHKTKPKPEKSNQKVKPPTASQANATKQAPPTKTPSTEQKSNVPSYEPFSDHVSKHSLPIGKTLNQTQQHAPKQPHEKNTTNNASPPSNVSTQNQTTNPTDANDDASIQALLDDLTGLTDSADDATQVNALPTSNWGKFDTAADDENTARYRLEVKPTYPEEEKEKASEGIVVLEFMLDAQGKAISQSINVINATTDNFLREALKALLASEFELEDTKKAEENSHVKVSITFSLDDLAENEENTDKPDIHDELGL